jgi:chemotaxis protein CheD
MNVIYVGIAEMKVAKSPHILTTLGLGSCVGAALFDPRLQLGGLIHILLPSTNGDPAVNKAKYADSGIPELIDQLISMGAKRSSIVAKIAGGANMFSSNSNASVFMVGQRNVEMCKDVLKKQKIRLISSDTGGTFGRTIEFNAENGQLLIKTIGHGTKYI